MTDISWRSGDAYETYVGRWSRRVAEIFVDWLDVPAGLRWLDVGCGTGALAGRVAAVAAPDLLVGVDSSRGFLSAVPRGRVSPCAGNGGGQTAATGSLARRRRITGANSSMNRPFTA